MVEESLQTNLGNLSKEDFDKVCRCCLSQVSLTSLFKLNYQDILISDLLLKLFNVQIESENDRPKNICNTCVEQVIQCYNFKRTLDNTEQIITRAVEQSLEIKKIKEEVLETSPEEVKFNEESFLHDFGSLFKREDEDLFAKIASMKQPTVVRRFFIKIPINGTHKNKKTKSLHVPIKATPKGQKSKNITIPIKDAPEDQLSKNINIPIQAAPNERKRKKSVNKRYRKGAAGPVTCHYCHEIFQSENEYFAHRRRRFDNLHRPKHPCQYCGKLFTANHLATHLRSHGENLFKCEICLAKLSCRLTLRRHMNAHLGVKSLICEVCGKLFIDGLALSNHHKKVHTDEKEFLCSYCGERFHYKPTYKHHLNKHANGQEPKVPKKIKNKEKRVKARIDLRTCEVCQRVFESKVVFREHMMTVHGGKSIVCDICKRAYYTRYELNLHSERMHSRGQKEFKISCELCSRHFRNRFVYESHMTSIHRETVSQEVLGETEFPCDICKKFYANKSSLNAHMVRHKGEKVLCTDCGKQFNSNTALKSHRIIHTGEKNYPCSYCDKKFSASTSLKTHVYIHTGERPYVCYICSKGFTSVSKLKIHLRTHTGEKPYRCSYCTKSFRTSTALTIHTRGHTGETPYVCDVCSKGFYHSSSLTKHRRIHFKQSNIKTEPPITSEETILS